MNGKKAKKLRRRAELVTVGQDSTGHVYDDRTGKGETFRIRGTARHFFTGATVRVKPGTTRGVYRKLKNER